MLTSLGLGLCYLVSLTQAVCHDPTPAFLPPQYDKSDPILAKVFAVLQQSVQKIADHPGFDTTSFSIEVTSSQDTLWSLSHTAKELDPSRTGVNPVDANSYYRVASITKIFTTHGILQQYAAGNLSLSDAVNKYLPQLSGQLPWKDITLRALVSHTSGIPRDCMCFLNSIRTFVDESMQLNVSY